MTVTEEPVEREAEGQSFFLAPVFDSVDPVLGPGFRQTRPVLEDLEEIRDLAAYLNAGAPVCMIPTYMPDILDPAEPEVVPLHFRTDGVWIWSDAITYYLETYGLAPEEHLFAYLKEQGVYNWEADPETIRQAAQLIFQEPLPEEEQVLWTTGE